MSVTSKDDVEKVRPIKDLNPESKEESPEELGEGLNLGKEWGPNLARISTNLSLRREITSAEISDAQKTPKKKGFYKKYFDRLLRYCFYPDIILDHLNRRDLTVIFRSWLMMWSLTLLCICGGTDQFMGPSSFLANFACGIEISGNLSISAAFVYCMTDEILLVFSFLVSVVTMAINWRLHGYLKPEDVIAILIEKGYCANVENPGFENCIEPHVTKGMFLTTRTTAVTVFGMLFSFTLCGIVQQRFKYARLAWLLNSLFTIVVFPFNNFLPLFEPWLYARNCMVPMSMAFTARFTVSALLLPFSSNGRILSNLSEACSGLQAIGNKMEDLLIDSQPSRDDISKTFEFIRGDAQLIFTKRIINEIDFEMVDSIEFWLSRMEKGELSELRSQVRLVMSAMSSFRFFYESINDMKLNILNAQEEIMKRHQDKSDNPLSFKYAPDYFVKKLTRSYKRTSEYEFLRRKERLKKLSTALQETTLEKLDRDFRDLTGKYEPLVRKSTKLLGCIASWLSMVPKIFRFKKELFEQYAEELQEALADVENSIGDYEIKGPIAPDFALHAYNCVHFSRRVMSLGRWCVQVHSNNTRLRLVTPFDDSVAISGLSADNENVVDGFHNNLDQTLNRTFTSFRPLGSVQARNPDSSPPRMVLHIVGMYIQNCVDALYAPDVLFCVKRAILTTVTLIPYFCRPICARAFRHWFLWVAVLTTYTIARQTVDGFYGLTTKFMYNFWGCLVGMVAWYISAGSGRGNPFSYAVVTAFVWLYICFQRQFNKHLNPSSSVVFNCTVTLVLGNSWNAGHIELIGVDLGRGFSVAWVRFVTVSIGISISFLGTIFPHAYTAKRVVRTIIGTCLEHVGDLYATISNFALQRYANSAVHIVPQSDIITKSARAIMTDLDSAETLRGRLIYEPPLSGFYPSNRYKLLINYSLELTQLMSLVYTFFDELEDTSQMPLVLNTMGWTSSRISGTLYSLLYMTSRAIADGKALPSVTSGYLATVYLCDVLPKHVQREDQTEPMNSLAISLTTQVYKRIDGIVAVVKELVGEVYDLNMDLYDLEAIGRM